MDQRIQEEEERVSKARLAVAEADDDLSILQQEMKGLVNQIDAHHREDDARRERSQGGNDDMEVFLLRRRIVANRLESRRRVTIGRR